MLRPGDEPIPGYRLKSFLGRGQFGQVWKCSAPGGGSAALKFLDLGGKEGWKEFRGIQRVKEIRHVHLMPITALWLLDRDGNILDDDTVLGLAPSSDLLRDTIQPGRAESNDQEAQWLVVAQLLGDKTLLDELEEYQNQGAEGIPLGKLLVYMEEAAKGIDFLNTGQHDLGDGVSAVQHCDIKPANMLLVGGSVLICDFGLAQLLTSGAGDARATGMLGSPAYIAPECMNHAPSSTSDQYSLAISYFELRTGDLPFFEQTPMAALDAHRSGELDFSRLPAAEREVIARATSMNPKDRYPSCLAMVDALQRAVGGGSAAAPQPKTVTPSWVPFPTKWLAVAAVAVAAMATAVFAISVFWPKPGPKPTVQEYTLRVRPAQASVQIDGEEYEVVDGEITIKREPDARLKIVASAGADFEVEVQEIDLSDHFADTPIVLELQPSALFFANQAFQQLKGNRLTAAIDSYVKAIEKDSRYAQFPDPLVLAGPNAASPSVGIRVMEISRDGKSLVVGDSQGVVSRYRLADDLSKVKPESIHTHTAAVEGLAVGNDWVVSAGPRGEIAVSSLSDGTGPHKSLTLKTFNVVKLAISGDGRFLLTGNGGKLERWDLSQDDLAQAGTLLGQHDELIEVIKVTSDNQSVITGSWDGFVKKWPINGSETVGENLGELSEDVYAVAISKQRVAMAGAEQGSDNHVFVADMESKQRQTLTGGHKAPIISLEFDQTGRALAAGSEDDGELSLWRLDDAEQWQPVPMPSQHRDSVNAIVFDPSSRFLVSGSNDGTVALWDTESNSRRVATLDQSPTPVIRVCIGSDGHWLFAAGSNGSVRAWDLRRCILIKRACDESSLIPQPAGTVESGVEA